MTRPSETTKAWIASRAHAFRSWNTMKTRSRLPAALTSGRRRIALPRLRLGGGRHFDPQPAQTRAPGARTVASVLAHEYPKPWVQALAYGGAAAVMGGRLLGRDHWSSDVFVGSALGYFIGSHIFHSHCNPKFSQACHAH